MTEPLKAFRFSDLQAELQSADLWLEARAEGSYDGIFSDTRELNQLTGSSLVFFCRRGLSKDGHQFIPELLKEGRVKAFVVEEGVDLIPEDRDYLVVRDSRLAMSLFAKKLYGDPTRDLLTCAITGTNGKTTSCFILEQVLKSAGFRTARMGTIDSRFENDRWGSSLTSPDFVLFQKLVARWKALGAESLVFEASSHALSQGRLSGVEVDLALFTNLSPEHLDYHKNMESYYQAKKILFSSLLRNSSKQKKIAILPEDQAYGSRLLEELKGSGLNLWSWGEGPTSEDDSQRLQLEEWSTSLSGSEVSARFRAEKIQFRSSLIGKHNVENLMGALTAGLALEMKLSEILSSLESFQAVPGRLERVPHPRSANVFVDYAHTPDALENVLQSLRPLCQGKLRLIFGCGGDRDRQKRPLMGQIAELFSDVVYLSSDNPRSEDPLEIINQVLQGMQKIKPCRVIENRRLAIETAISEMEEKDVLLIAGKGHETTQEIMGQEFDFDDREVVRAYSGA
ncbi:MAG: UDP-N-acetylmuramoyl-L-alanyl-D-glutamate--2,6-diaminopimelate ligase [Bradymonadales bacterium]|nr:MAG: UDP-N-acetylmuramoyl-L-alanyl-D-glutamate--2,6-diaminopimelate ligase [Bradymonadales bacterium]